MTTLCPQCYLGRLTIEDRLFLLHDGRRVLIAPKTAAICCDHCDFVEYDPEALQQLGELLEAPLITRGPARPENAQKKIRLHPLRESSHDIQ